MALFFLIVHKLLIFPFSLHFFCGEGKACQTSDVPHKKAVKDNAGVYEYL
jgi:hypothetical protein